MKMSIPTLAVRLPHNKVLLDVSQLHTGKIACNKISNPAKQSKKAGAYFLDTNGFLAMIRTEGTHMLTG